MEVGGVHHSGESVNETERNLQPQLLYRLSFSIEVDHKIHAVVAPLATQLETLIESVSKLIQRSSNRSTEGNAPSERSSSSGQHSDMVTRANRHPRSDLTTKGNPFDERHFQHRYNERRSVGNTFYWRIHYMAPEDASDGESDNQMDQVLAAITDLPRRLHTTQVRKKLLQIQMPVLKDRKNK